MNAQGNAGWFVGLAVCSALMLTPGRLQAQAPTCNADRFLDTSFWSGSVSITGTGAGSYTDSFGRTFSYSIQQSIDLEPTFPLGNLSPEQWSGPENATVSVNDTYTEVTNDPAAGTITTTQTFSGNGTTAMGGLGTGAGFGINSVPLSCGYAFGADFYFPQGTLTSTTVSKFGTTTSSSQGLISWGPGNIPNMLAPPATATSPQQVIPFPAAGLLLSGNSNFQAPPFDVPSGFDTTNVTVDWVVRWNFNPVPRTLDLIVTIPNYDSWRPTAGKDEHDLGFTPPATPNLLTITAQLVFKDNQQPTPFGPDKITFALNSSSEPGVALNWPPQNSLIQGSPDMSFKSFLAGAPINTSFTLNADGTQAVLTPPDPTSGNVPATIFLIPYDWGAWATLNVTALALDQDIQGHFVGDTTTNILLPKRQPGSHIADIWKNQHKIDLTTPDNDDSETSPAGRPDCIGDGFTLYEEYRGFMENGKHIEGDPKSKDFFIRNEIGADAEPGIFMFTDLTGLTVHKDLKEIEVQTSDTHVLIDGISQDGNPLINFNHSQGAHTDQHAVLVRTCGKTDGGDTSIKGVEVTIGDQKLSPHGNPATTNLICMQDRDVPGTLNPENTHSVTTADGTIHLLPGVITPSDALQQYDVGIAHELLHSVGVKHHGDRADEGPEIFRLLAPMSTINPGARAILQEGGTTVSLLDESSQDQVGALWQSVQKVLSDCQNTTGLSNEQITACNTVTTNFQNDVIPLQFWVGLPQGKLSGNDDCVMRYFFAQLYPQNDDPLTFYIVGSGTEPLGSLLDDSSVGTGINDANRALPLLHPQPRYFDARPGRGSCQKWVCVSDKYPPAMDSQ